MPIYKSRSLEGKYALNTLSLKFLHKEVEASFRINLIASVLLLNRVALILAFIMYSAFLFLDYQIIPESFSNQLLFRMIGCFSILVSFIISFLPVFKKYQEIFISIPNLLSGHLHFVMLSMSILPPDYIRSALCLMILYTYFFTGIRLHISFWIANSYIFTYFLYSLFFADFNFFEILYENFWIVSTGSIGIISAYVIEFMIRKGFVQSILIQDEKQKSEEAKEETEALNILIKSLNEDVDIKAIMRKVYKFVHTNFNINYFGLVVVNLDKETAVLLDSKNPDFIPEGELLKLNKISTKINTKFGAHASAFAAKRPIYAPKIRLSALTPEEIFHLQVTKAESILILPLILKNEPIGFLDFYNVGKMKLSRDDITKLSILSGQLAGIIYSSNLFKEVEERTTELNNTLKVIRRDLAVAKKIQQNTLQTYTSPSDKLTIIPAYIPMSEVGGDYYDIFQINEYTFRIFLADATGHGVQAAMITMAIKGIYDNIKTWEFDANKVMELFNNDFINRYGSLDSFLTAIILDIDLKKKKISFSSGGHPSGVLLRNSKIQLLESTGTLIGVEKHHLYKLGEIDFFPGDRLFIFTDGSFEEFNLIEENFGEERLYSLLSEYSNLSIEEANKEVLKNIYQFLDGKTMQDDITIIGIEYKK